MAIGDYNFAVTHVQIITAALRKIGAMSPGQPLDGDEYRMAQQALNLIAKDWQNDNVFLWTEIEVSIPLVAGTDHYSTGDDPPLINLFQARLRDTAGTDYPLKVIRWDEYQEILTKADTGQTTHIAFNPMDGGVVYLYPVPDATTAAWDFHLIGIRAMKDLQSASDAGDFPVRWHRALIYALAADLAPEYGISGKDLESLENKAAFLFLKAKQADKDNDDDSFVEGAY